MVGCVAWGCSNRSEKKIRMFGFPLESERRKKWLINVSRSNLTITKDPNYRKLCEAHFEADQFQRSRKGKTRLKADAIPTIFAHRPKVKRRKPPAPRDKPEPVNLLAQITTEHSYTAKADTDERKKQKTDGHLASKIQTKNVKGNTGSLPSSTASAATHPPRAPSLSDNVILLLSASSPPIPCLMIPMVGR